MQLKRDNDYAMRILFCLKETIVFGEDKQQISFTLSEIASKCGLMRTSTRRICDCLAESGLIHISKTDGTGETAYYADPSMLKRSLLDVVEAIENTGKIFAVFDKKTRMYKKCRNKLERVERKCERVLATAFLEDLIGEKDRSV